jgi:integrase
MGTGEQITKKFEQNPGLEVSNFLKKLDSVTDKKTKIILRLLFETGCSLSEVTQITAEDFFKPTSSDQSFKIFFKKTSRTSMISSGAGELLIKFLIANNRANKDFIFSRDPKKPASVKRIEQIFSSLFPDSVPQQIRYMHIFAATQKGLGLDAIVSQTGLKRQRIGQILEILNVKKIESYSSFFENSIENNFNKG